MKRWIISKTTYKVSDFISWYRAGSLTLSPSFQRRSVWNPGQKSYLIDSVVRGLPIPSIFLREQKSDLKKLEPQREVVDGQQRIRTLIAYISPESLVDYDQNRDNFLLLKVHNSEFADKSFKELPRETQQEILDYEFSVHVMPSKVEDTEVLEIFARMNATGVKINRQELRNASFFGEFKTSMYQLASEQLSRWREWKLFTEDNIARMNEVELTSELCTFILRGVTARKQSGIDKIYAEYDKLFKERGEVEKRFRVIMDTLDDYFGASILANISSKKTLFYAIFAVIYIYQFGAESFQNKTVSPSSISRKEVNGLIEGFNKIKNKDISTSVSESISRRTTDVSSRKVLTNFLLDCLNNV